ncbi:pilus assembly FimT family protein [Rhodopirellula halodulae]|uniref:pilus assembly FimT family protein n=1 Tax=Rhodopirellula halodulae TaxID=2894198 RepID=UPI001E2E746D|nr:GspH/FimT family pseudopilin [Rhodopirellula sp. JC737]MCC9658067.1 GspH/FimT family pseudopilin [Rhodopirellula sp. JC737]
MSIPSDLPTTTNVTACCGRRRHGVTLVEALMVIMVLTASMVAAPRVGQLFSQRTTVDQDSALVLRTLRLARETAVLRKCSVTVRWRWLRDDEGTYRTVLDLTATPGVYSDGRDAFGAPSSPGANTWMSKPIELHPEVRVRGNASSIVFTATGSANRDLELVVSRDTTSVDVNVQSASGNIYKTASP